MESLKKQAAMQKSRGIDRKMILGILPVYDLTQIKLYARTMNPIAKKGQSLRFK